MVSRSMLVARAGIRASLMSVTYDRLVIIRLNDAKTRPIAARTRYPTQISVIKHVSEILNILIEDLNPAG